MQRRTWIATSGALLATLAGAAPAAAEPAAGVTPGNALVTFDTARPGSFTSIRPIAGLQPGEYVSGIDFRFVPLAGAPADASTLYAIGVVHGAADDTLRTYRIDTGTGQATQVGSPLTGITSTGDLALPAAYGVDFNHTVDRIRVVNTANENLRINPNNGARGDAPINDTDLTPGFAVAAAGYDRVDGDATTGTTLFGLAHATSSLVTIGGVNSTPSPNLGQLFAVGALGITSGDPFALNLDVSPGGTAYATARPGTAADSLYTVASATGAATLVGQLALPLHAFAVLPTTTAQFSTAAATVTEGAGTTLTVTRSGPANGSASVRYATADGSATSADYVPAGGVLTFAPGETSKTIALATKQDSADEPNATFTVALSEAAAPLTLGAPASATVTIADDDAPPAATPAPDRRAPRATLSAPGRVTLAAFLKRGIRVSARVDERASLAFALEAAPRSARLAAAYRLTLAGRRFGASTATRSTTLKPVRKLVGTPRRAFKVRVRVTATDAAGNSRTSTRLVTVTVPRR
ncbi:DUF4394 domain-containing protein [Conexibacter stalactiti]|uniref:DUF4394 domain-containing protein n=1 Tax=Conexibacter stalactiti TaxID=1940611 RepID=A0ABU4HQ19_9ACTN|nr:DUF4394 domain-containing protein [Conexibacter stalactiti]MDW5594824.1 DUF4394 domain-containing protein [Conexibacter stalactiti]MEC5035466.1 DUF4394 domain-containing protein [Conexibacter stalactiti]